MSLKKIPNGVVALGLVSMFMDISSEMIHSVLPVFLVSALGASALTVGVIEGIAESTAAFFKIFSGAVSDWIGKRKPLLLLGYGIAVLTRPLFPLAQGAGEILFARFVDRIGKGIRGAPRDALLADITPDHLRGAAFGFRQSLDTLGAVVGPAMALVLMLATQNDFRLVFWMATIPAALVLVIIVFGIKDPKREKPFERKPFPLRTDQLCQLNAAFWFVTALAFVLMLARFSEAFLVLRGNDVGLKPAYTPLILIIMNVVYTATAYPAGKLSDKIGEYGILRISILVLIAANLVLGFSAGIMTVFMGAALWGLNMGLSQGIMAAIVAREAPSHLRGTAFGVFNFLSGVALLLASVIAGGLWKFFGPSDTFMVAAVFAAVALLGFTLKREQKTL